MKKLYSFASFLIILLIVDFCGHPIENRDTDSGRIKITIHTIDEDGDPVPANLIYEQQDCEFDFNAPQAIKTNKNGVAILLIEPGYLQLYAEGFLHESYHCRQFSSNTNLEIYAAPIPTFIKVVNAKEEPIAGETVEYFSNTSGNCIYEDSPDASTIKTDENGLAKVYLPQNDTYKIQVKGEVKCFQPSQSIDTLTFIKN